MSQNENNAAICSEAIDDNDANLDYAIIRRASEAMRRAAIEYFYLQASTEPHSIVLEALLEIPEILKSVTTKRGFSLLRMSLKVSQIIVEQQAMAEFEQSTGITLPGPNDGSACLPFLMALHSAWKRRQCKQSV